MSLHTYLTTKVDPYLRPRRQKCTNCFFSLFSNLAPMWTESYLNEDKKPKIQRVVEYIKAQGLEKYPGGLPTTKTETGSDLHACHILNIQPLHPAPICLGAEQRTSISFMYIQFLKAYSLP